MQQIDLKLPGDAKLAKRALVLAPKGAINPQKNSEKYGMLVLLHGLGETGNELLGIHAWGEKYGLVSAHERLAKPPIQPTLKRQRYLTESHQQELNTSIARQPYKGVVMVCPVTPNPYRLAPAERTLTRYADWLEQVLLPEVRRVTSASHDRAHTALDGCSLGGYVGIEVMLRKPHVFGCFGGVQSAFGTQAAQNYADKLAGLVADYGPLPIRLGTSTEDPYRAANEHFSRRLRDRRVPHELSVLPGPHNQPWLREIGTPAMLRWHDQQIAL